MKKFAAGLVKKRGGESVPSQIINGTPEENVSRGVRLFCESGGPNDPNSESQEYLHLPTIVDSAESSPAAAKAAAQQIRKTLKENYQKPYVQYNAIMLIRILTDNPGRSFTQNIDDKFVNTVATLLRQGRDQSVQQLLMETLYALETGKAYDNNLLPLMAMWRKERSTIMQKQSTAAPQPAVPPVAQPSAQWAPYHMQAQPPQQRHRSRKQLPSPAELAGRIEEARMSAQLLTQVTQSTLASDLASSELAREFAERCQNSQRTLQGYMNCTDPAPDEQTFQTLIEICEQLNIATSKYQRALLAARRESTILPASIGDQATNKSSATPQPNVPTQLRNGAFAGGSSQPQTQSRNPYYVSNEAQFTSLYPPSANAAPPKSSIQPTTNTNSIASGPKSMESNTRIAQSQSTRATNTQAAATPTPGGFEIPLSSTPPLGPTILGPINSFPPNELSHDDDDDDFEPPPGPPPNKRGTLPVRESVEPNSTGPPTEGSDDLYASNSPVVENRSVSSPSESYPRSSVTLNHYSDKSQSPSTQQRQETLPTNPFMSPEDSVTPISVEENAIPSSAQNKPVPGVTSPQRNVETFPSQSSVGLDATATASAGAGVSTVRIPTTVKDDEPLTPLSVDAWRSGRF